MDEKEQLIRAALRDMEPDEDRWKHFGVLVVPTGSCPEAAVREYLKRSPRPFTIPLEALTYTVRYIGGDKVVIVDLRRVDAMHQAVEAAFKGRHSLPRDGFFRA